MANTTPTVLFVGEAPPPKAPAGFTPFDCDAGDRLAKLGIGLVSREPFIRHVARANIFDEPGVGIASVWNDEEARVRGAELLIRHPATIAPLPVVALGRKVAAAFEANDVRPFTWRPLIAGLSPVHVIAVPHPSGKSTSMNTETARQRCRRALVPELVAGCPGLRPWHWRLDDPEVALDLGAALSPLDVGLGVAVALVVGEMHKAITAARPGKDEYVVGEYVGHSLRTLLAACLEGQAAVLDLWGVPASKARDFASRANHCRRTERVKEYPAEVLRATVGRYVALGVM